MAWMSDRDADLDPALAVRLMELGAAGRYASSLATIGERWPGGTADPARLPARPGYLVDVVVTALVRTGRYSDARAFVDRVPASRLDGRRRRALLVDIAERGRVFGGLASLRGLPEGVTTVKEPGGRTTVAGAVRVHLACPGHRVDVVRVRAAIQGIAARLEQRFGARPVPLRVEVHSDPASFSARAAALGGEPQPRSGGLALPGVLLVLMDTSPDADPHGLWLRLRHEYVHAALRALASPAYLPYWLEEGLAIHLTQQLPRAMLAAWGKVLSARCPTPLAHMGERFPGVEGLEEVAYAQSAVAAACLAEMGDAALAAAIAAGHPPEWWCRHPLLAGRGIGESTP